MPGPGSYEVGKIVGGGNKEAKDHQDEEEDEKRKKMHNFNHYKQLQQKMNVERYNYEDKKKKHVEQKKDLQARIGPGAYINPKQHSEFRQEPKPEYLQFFGSTEERFKHGLLAANSIPGLLNPSGSNSLYETMNNPNATTQPTKDTLPGPGTYNPIKDI